MSKDATSSAEGIKWDLSDLYKGMNDPDLEKDIEHSLKRADEFRKKYDGKLKDASLSPGEFKDALKEFEDIYETLDKVAYFSILFYSQNTQDPERGALYARSQQKSSELKNKLIFFELEWQSLDDKTADDYIRSEELSKYKNFLKHWRKYKPYRLSESEEQIIESLQNTGKKAFVRLFDETIGDISVDIKDKKMVFDQALSLLYDQERETRKEAAQVVTEALRDKNKILTFIFNNIVLNHSTIGEFRGYPDPMTPRNLDNRVEKETVDALIKACMDNVDVVKRFYELKRRLMGYDVLYDYDRYCPMPGATPEITYEDSKKRVLEAYEKFSPKMREIAEEFFDKGWIDAELKPGKRGGAFSAATVPSVHPYILLNFTDRTRDMMTMAHELGHGVHQYLGREQGYLQQSTPLTTAEMASVFGEMLLFDKMISEVDDPKVKLTLLGNKLQDDFATVFRQIVMTRFEQKLHKRRNEKGELTAEEINEIWLEANREQFGDSVELTNNYGWWWSYILHFIHYPFYCYAYAFGELLVLALYDLYKEEGDAFVPKYLDMLRRGGSENPEELLNRVGVDITDPKFWERGLALLREHVETAEKLAEEAGMIK